MNKKIIMAAVLLLGLVAMPLLAQERRQLLLEQFSSESCPNCITGTAEIEQFVASMVEQVQFSKISHHAGYYPDFLTVPESEGLTHLFSIFADKARPVPGFMIDRVLHDSQVAFQVWPETLEAVTKTAMSKAETVTIEEITLSFDATTRRFKAKMHAKALDNYEGGDNFYLNLAITESHIKAEQQAGIQEGVAYYHNHALRRLLAGANGLQANPNNAVGEWEINIPETWDIAQLRVVAFVHRAIGSEENLPSDPSIYITREYDFPPSGTAISSVDEEQMGIYYADGKLKVMGDYRSLKVYDLQGRLCPTSNLQSGLYIAVIERAYGSYSKKIRIR